MNTHAHHHPLMTALAFGLFMFFAAAPLQGATGSGSATALTDTRDYTLTVASAQGGNPVPGIGTHSYAWHATVTASVDATADGHTCTGWTGTGAVPESGTTNTTGAILLTEVASSITWQWLPTGDIRPDLSLTAADLRILNAAGEESGNAVAGEQVTVEVRLRNTGNTATPEDILVQLFLDGAPSDLSAYDLSAFTVAASTTVTESMPVGGTRTLLLPWTVTGPVREATLTAVAEFATNRAQSQANAEGVPEPLPVTEISFANNSASRSLQIGLPPPGDLDSSFFPYVNAHPEGVSVQPDGRIIVAGWFSRVGGVNRRGMARIDANGALDAAFDPNPDGTVHCVAVQPDGDILLGGDFNQVGGVLHWKIARLRANGALDPGFALHADNGVYSIGTQPDGGILLSGNFNRVGGNDRWKVARLLADGSFDSGFVNPSVGAQVWTHALLPDGKILIGGAFDTVASTPRMRLARLLPDGSLDPTFDDPNVNGVVNALVVQPDGKILIAGSFTSVGGVARSRVARLHADGSPDTTFATVGVDNFVLSMVLQADGKVIVGGRFIHAGATPRLRLARFHADGSLDDSFAPAMGTGTGVDVVSIALQEDGKILAGGNFSTVNGTFLSGSFARLHNDPATQELSVSAAGRVGWQRGGSAPELERVWFELSTDDGATWTALAAGTPIAGGWEATGLSLPAAGVVRARGVAVGGYYNGSRSLFESQASFAPNAPPAFAGYELATPFQTAAAVALPKLLAKASDPDGDAVTVSAAGPASDNGGTAVLQGAAILYTPPAGFSGSDSFTITITDSHGASSAGTVTIHVGDPPHAGAPGGNPPKLTALPGGRMGIVFQGIPGRAYIVQRAVGGLHEWETLATITADDAGRVSFTDENPPPGSAFYRLGLP